MMKFNLISVFASIIALIVAMVLIDFQEIMGVKVLIVTFIGFSLLTFGLGLRQGFKTLLSQKNE